jgi:exosome complex exonuclease DIS3/RRP44
MAKSHVCWQAYARSLKDMPELVDLVAASADAEQEMDVDSLPPGKNAKRKRIYEDHRPMSSITAGIKNGTLHQVGNV